MTSSDRLFSETDLDQIRERGIDPEEARRQVALLRGPNPYAELDRPCTVGDGIATIPEGEIDHLLDLHAQAARSGRCTKFVPASGAATRMFRDLLHYQTHGQPVTRAVLERDLEAGKPEALALRRFLDGIPRFAFLDQLGKTLASRGRPVDETIGDGAYGEILNALLSPDGLDYARLPKGLVRFHDYPEGSRTPFEEHLLEGAEILRDAGGTCRAHFTVSPAHLAAFTELLERVRHRYARERSVDFDVSFSAQKPSTDTLAVDDDGLPFRDADGRLLFRPAGHGALLENLNDLRADIVLIKNIDNVAPDWLKPATIDWARALIGHLLELQQRNGSAGTDRPVRVCGVVPATGEAGGGPFWVRDKDGVATPQIVEGAQIDPESPAQQEILKAVTHFNPVFIACGVRRRSGEPFDLSRYVDPAAVIVTSKSFEGRGLRALERPGLWNGAMARWNTVFVEVPGEIFNPVKTVLDLLRPEHQPA
jgi:hypothetical protein